MTMQHRISAFLEAQAAELDAAQNTQLAYARDLQDFAEWLAPQGRDFESVTREDIESYLIDCGARGFAVSTRARRLSAIKQLFRFAFEEGWRTDNPALQIKGPGRQKSLPKVLDEAEVDRLLAAARTLGRTPAERLRNTCLMELLYATGMRVSELVSLPWPPRGADPRCCWSRARAARNAWCPCRARRSRLWRNGWRSAMPKTRNWRRSASRPRASCSPLTARPGT